MASNIHISAVRRNGMLDNLTAQLNSGFLDIYDGSQPATPETNVGAQVKLTRLTFGATAFAAASGGTATANAITNGTGLAASAATWARLLTSGGTAVMDCSVGTASTDLIINSAAIQTNATVSCSLLTISLPS